MKVTTQEEIISILNGEVVDYLDGDRIRIHGLKCASKILINKIQFEKSIYIENCHFQDLEFNNCVFLKYLTLGKGLILEGWFEIAQCILKEGFQVIGAEFKSLLRFRQTKCEGHIGFTSGSALNIMVLDYNEFGGLGFEEGFNVNGTFEIHRGLIGKVYSDQCNGDWLKNYTQIGSLMLRPKGIRKIRIEQCRINQRLTIEAVSHDSNILLADCAVKNFHIGSFSNSSKFKIMRLCPADEQSAIYIYDSSMDATEFFQVDFRKFSQIGFSNSQIHNCVFTNVDWGDNLCVCYGFRSGQFGLSFSEGELEDTRQMRDFYRQLKLSYANQKDTMLSNHFYSKEMHELRNEGALTNALWSLGRLEHFFVVVLNGLISDYGNNLLKSLRTLIVFHLLMVLLLIAVGNGLNVHFIDSIAGFNWRNLYGGFIEGLKLYSYTLFPTFNLTYGETLLNPVVAALMRIGNSVIIYHVIKSSRKMIK
ncbi:MAG: hypothetical protein COW03_13355 [Cytophagales bacterium CG12_big_fil_rev_8_21_14_0_65_40_12]|nr:MAG: hypothetical protein COW03_13355 [Cytophagales bacterium CG12_big_fil_rev_8_21_14_0_65_40_12]PIW03122.1 MAG: hypothetical protein COW40_17430 [Cytophagales bacterium CG17_big_fil_post_rev_8_21_14_2_50_40_13]